MSLITPQTNIKLLKVPLSIDNNNQLTFSNATAQYNYFNSLPKKEYDSCTYQRKDGYIAFNEDMDSLINYNYVMYQNNEYGNDKWFYAYISRMEYQNNKCTYVYLETDVYQTWQFDLTFKRSFVEREHTNNDSVGANTIPENIELGEFKANSMVTYTPLTGSYKVILATTVEPLLNANDELIGGNTGGGIYGNVPVGYKYYAYSLGSSLFDKTIKAFADAGKSDSIMMVFLLPSVLAGTNIEGGECANTVGNDNWNFSKQSSLDGYTPINKKLLCYPFNYLYVNNNNGGNAIYHYEKFSSSNVNFQINSIVAPSGSIHLFPTNYNGVTTNPSEMLSGAKYPMCGYQKDVYTNWLTQNGLNLSTKLVGSVAMMIGGVAAAATGLGLPVGAGSALTGLAGVTSTLQQIYQEKHFTPPQSDNIVNIADINYANNLSTFVAYKMSVKAETARVIDDFFSMYGYKTNRVKVPNRTGRSNWNYVKTIGCNITANIPQEDLKKIKSMFDNGITLWHNTATFLDYSQSNPIV